MGLNNIYISMVKTYITNVLVFIVILLVMGMVYYMVIISVLILFMYVLGLVVSGLWSNSLIKEIYKKCVILVVNIFIFYLCIYVCSELLIFIYCSCVLYFYYVNSYYYVFCVVIIILIFMYLFVKEFRYLGFYIVDLVYGCIFFLLVCLHYFHVVIGLLMLCLFNYNLYNYLQEQNVYSLFI